jgi:hypothetical protein
VFDNSGRECSGQEKAFFLGVVTGGDHSGVVVREGRGVVVFVGFSKCKTFEADLASCFLPLWRTVGPCVDVSRRCTVV